MIASRACRRAMLLVPWIALLAGPTFAADDPIGAVERVTPDAFGTPSQGQKAPLAAADRVVADETIETTRSGSLHIRFVDESDLWLDANSAVVLDELVFKKDESTGAFIAELGPGLFRFVTGKLPHAAYEIRTPVAVIGVRGTDFAVAVAKNGATRVTSYEHAVTEIGRAHV